MNKYALIIEDEACWGCRTCEIACMQEFAFEKKFLHLSEVECTAKDNMPGTMYRVHVCRHCDDPPCAAACPEDAISKRADGIVILNEELCSGCGSCMEACPYDSITFDAEINKALKCNLCFERVDNGLYPACADNVCLAHCIYFGDPEEIRDTIDKKREKRQAGY